MSATAKTMVTGMEPQGAERRVHARHAVMLPGKFYRHDGSEHSCVTENVSEGGFEIITGRKVFVGEKLTLAIHILDRIEVEVMRITPRGFGARILRTSMGNKAFVTQLRWLVNAQNTGRGTVDQRRHARFVPAERSTTVQLKGRQPVEASLVDVSQSGAAVDSDVPVSIGTKVLIGRKPSTVVRLTENGFAVRFDTPLERPAPKAPAAPPAYV